MDKWHGEWLSLESQEWPRDPKGRFLPCKWPQCEVDERIEEKAWRARRKCTPSWAAQ